MIIEESFIFPLRSTDQIKESNMIS